MHEGEEGDGERLLFFLADIVYHYPCLYFFVGREKRLTTYIYLKYSNIESSMVIEFSDSKKNKIKNHYRNPAKTQFTLTLLFYYS